MGNGFAYDTAGFERQLRQCQHFASAKVGSAACESAVGSGAATTYLSAVPNFSIKLGNLIKDECDPLYYMRCYATYFNPMPIQKPNYRLL